MENPDDHTESNHMENPDDSTESNHMENPDDLCLKRAVQVVFAWREQSAHSGLQVNWNQDSACSQKNGQNNTQQKRYKLD